jgi:hypothetical protein
MLTYVKQGAGFRAALVDRAGRELGHGSASTRTGAMTAAACAAARAGHKSEATSPGVLKELSHRDAEKVRACAGLQSNPKKRRRPAKRRKAAAKRRAPARRKNARGAAGFVWTVWAEHEDGAKGFTGHQFPDKGAATEWKKRLQASHPGTRYELRRMRATHGSVIRGSLGRGTSKSRRSLRRYQGSHAHHYNPKKRRRKVSRAPSRDALDRARAEGIAQAYRRMGYKARITRG